MFYRGVEHPQVATQVEPFVERHLAGVLVDFSLDDERRLPLAGVHLHHSIGKVAILYRRYTCDNLHALDIRGTYRACRRASGLARLGIVAQTHAIHLHGGAKRGVAFLRRSTAKRHAGVGHEGGIDGLATGKQCGDVAHIEQLLVVKGGAVDNIRSGGLIGLPLCHDGHLVEFQVLFLEPECEVGHVAVDGHRPTAFLVAQTLHGEGHFAHRHVLHRELALLVGDGPQTTLGQ